MANQFLPGYQSRVGAKIYSIFDHSGPASYTQVTPGTTPVGGDLVNAIDLGMGGIERFESGLDTTAQWSVSAIPVSGGFGNAIPTVRLKWTALVTATVGGQAQTAGSEAAAATNLSTFNIRAGAWGV